MRTTPIGLAISLLISLLLCSQVWSSHAVTAQAKRAAPAPQPMIANLKPTGSRYAATVPDTLDLAERARLSVHGLTSFLNERANYAPYGHTYFDANPPYFSDLPGGPPNWGKIAESLIFARLMCGSEENLNVEAQTLCGMLAPPVLRPDKTYAFSPDYMRINSAAPTPLTRAMLALIALDQVAPTPQLKSHIDQMAADHAHVASHGDEGDFYSDPPPLTGESRLGIVDYGFQVFVNGCALRALARWSALYGDNRYRDTNRQLAKFALQDRFWTPEAAPKAVIGAEQGQFSGHIHSYTQCLMGLLWYAEVAHNTRLKEFVRSGYEYLRNFGMARIGLFGEGCATGDMTYLALKLSDLGVGDYWDDADQYLRNHLAELQITDASKLRRATDQMPAGRGRWDPAHGPLDPLNESAENVVARNVGIFFSDASHPTQIPGHSMMVTICCTGNCTPALYAAWESITRYRNGDAQVNLLLNRASPWLDVDSYLPYEGKVVLHNKTAHRISVRIPLWVEKAAVRCRIDGKPVTPFWAGQYAIFDSTRPGANLVITFPMVETTETYRLAWKQSDFWQECLNPGSSWQKSNEVTRYACHFRGNTLVDIAPRAEGVGYPLYQRDEMKRTKAPMHRVVRYLAPNLAKW